MEITITIRDSATGASTTATHVSGAADATPASAAASSYAVPGGVAAMSGSAERGSVLQPPEDVLRAAAASGAANGGPAPMLAMTSLDNVPGAPQIFVGTGGEQPTLAARGSQDQPGGAAPGAAQAAPAVAIAAQNGGGAQ